MKHSPATLNIVVIGAGISGLTAALHIAESGGSVILADKAGSSGGILPMLDHQFINDHCGMCRILPMIQREGSQDFCLKRGVFHDNIEFLPSTTITSIDGAPGNMTVAFKAVDADRRFEKTGVSAVILAGGADLYDPSDTDVYGMAHMPNVVTAMAFERLISGKKLARPSDGREPKKIAWIQCVGSRNITSGSPFCSSACCMFAVKEAMLAKEKTAARADTAIFYMDMRTYGRDFQRYRDAAEKEKGVRFIRCRIHSIEPAELEGDLDICYVDALGRKQKETFHLVVLSTGKNPLDETSIYHELAAKEGVYLLESAKEFRDISEAVKGAQASVCDVAGIIGHLSTDQDETKRTFDEAVVTRKPNPLVLIRKADADVDNMRLNVNRLFQPIETITLDTPFADAFEQVDAFIKEKKINRLLVASKHPAADFPAKSRLSKQLGIPPEYIRVVSLLPAFEPVGDAAETEAFIVSRIAEGLSYLLRARRYPDRALSLMQTAMVIGSGPAGLSAAKALSDAGVDVVVLEKEAAPGGNLNRIADETKKARLDALLEEVQHRANIRIITGAELTGHSGRPGNFTASVKLLSSGNTEAIPHGAVIVATGGGMAQPISYAYGTSRQVVTLHDLQHQMKQPTSMLDGLNSVVMIQCVDSREEPRNYCSRICCATSLETAIALKKHNPDLSIVMFYRDMMTYGKSEALYTEARQRGVVFVPYDPEQKPLVRHDSNIITVEADDPLSGLTLRLTPDRLVLAPGLIPAPDASVVGLLGLDTTADGFIKEADNKWRPVDTGKEGMFVCGLARAPGRIDEIMEDGRAAASRAMRLLGRQKVAAASVSAKVKHAVCSKCGICIEVCPFNARYYDEQAGNIQVDPSSCQGCGSCAVDCPNSATVISGFEDGAVMDALETVL